MLFRALRPLNLLLVALTQGVCWVYLRWKLPVMDWQVLSMGNMALLVGSTVSITAAGYLINDMFDTAIDARNKPQKALPNFPETKRTALRWYWVLNAVGLLAAAPVALASGKPSLLSIQALTILLLWAYSAWWKRLPVIGNLVVALLTALSIALLYLYEPALWVPEADRFMAQTIRQTVAALLGLSGFAFVLTWMRELVKDIEDLEGDRAEGCRTLPIVWGIKNTVRLTIVLSGLCLLALTALAFRAWTIRATGAALLFTAVLILPLLFWTYQLIRAKTSKEFGILSNQLKLLILGGLLCLWAV